MAIDRLSTLDQLMLWASRRWPQDIGALAVLDGAPLLDEAGRFRMDRVRDSIAARLPLVPRFRQVIHDAGRGLGAPFWVDVASFDISSHVLELPLEGPAGEAELLAATEGILRRRLNPGRPLWEMWFMPGLPEGRVGLFVRIHHAIADGMAAMATLAYLLESQPHGPAVVPGAWVPAPRPSGLALFADNIGRGLRGLAGSAAMLARPRSTLRHLASALPAIRELLAEQPATRTSIDRTVGAGRRVAIIRTSQAAVRKAARARNATVNDVLLAATGAGLRSLLLHRGEPVEGTTVRIYVPVSLRRRLRGPQQGNRIAQMSVPLRLGRAEPGARLAEVAAETTRRKARARTSLDSLMIGGAVGRRLLLFAVMRQRVNATSASIPGPRSPLYLAGARILHVYPVLPLVADEPLGVGAVTYAGELTIGIAADRDTFPDLDVLVASMRAELDALGVPTASEPGPPVERTAITPPRPGPAVMATGPRLGPVRSP